MADKKEESFIEKHPVLTRLSYVAAGAVIAAAVGNAMLDGALKNLKDKGYKLKK